MTKPMSPEERRGLRSLTALYLEVSESIADDVQDIMKAWVRQAKREAYEDAARVADQWPRPTGAEDLPLDIRDAIRKRAEDVLG